MVRVFGRPELNGFNQQPCSASFQEFSLDRGSGNLAGYGAWLPVFRVVVFDDFGCHSVRSIVVVAVCVRAHYTTR